MIYSANFNVNNGTRLSKNITGTSLKKVLQTVKQCAKAEIFLNPGNAGWFYVLDEHNIEILSGLVYVSKNRKAHTRVVNNYR